MNGTVGLHRNETAPGSQPGFLGLDYLEMLWIDLWNDHGDIGGPTVGTVVGNNRAFQLGIGFFQGTNFFLFHVNGTENEVDGGRNGFSVCQCIQDHQGLGFLRDRGGHGPAGTDSLFIRFSSGTGTGRHDSQLKPGMVFQQGHKTLAHHPSGTDDTDSILFHEKDLLILLKLPENSPFCWEVRNSS